MNKLDLVLAVVEKTGFTRKGSETAINSIVESISEALADGQKVKLAGFGNFEVKNRAPRPGRNLKTNELIKVPAYKAPVFKPGKPLKKAVNGTK